MPDKSNYNPLYLEGEHSIRQQFDFAWTGIKLLVEINGATHINGRHVQPEGYKSDHEKYNRASLGGWTVLVFTEDHVQKSRYAGYAVEQTALAIQILRAKKVMSA